MPRTAKVNAHVVPATRPLVNALSHDPLIAVVHTQQCAAWVAVNFIADNPADREPWLHLAAIVCGLLGPNLPSCTSGYELTILMDEETRKPYARLEVRDNDIRGVAYQISDLIRNGAPEWPQ